IMEAAYLYRMGASSKEEMVYEFCRNWGIRDSAQFISEMSRLASHDMIEQFFLPWHEMYPHVARELARPSNLYGTVMYEAQGGVDGSREVDMLAAAHITGGGIPLKAYRMMKSFGLGIDINTVFPQPRGVQLVKQTYDSLPENIQRGIGLSEEKEISTWNGGVGFMVVTATPEDAEHLIEIAARQNVAAALMGKTLDRREIRFRGHTWRYT
ncbi:MAG: AIR synthase-related protein, partial [Candidatus Roizmanbacteria bacterium]|nr:AIR synthase-related protein [Candidatus Roizmanbacteria bacterium]